MVQLLLLFQCGIFIWSYYTRYSIYKHSKSTFFHVIRQACQSGAATCDVLFRKRGWREGQLSLILPNFITYGLFKKNSRIFPKFNPLFFEMYPWKLFSMRSEFFSRDLENYFPAIQKIFSHDLKIIFLRLLFLLRGAPFSALLDQKKKFPGMRKNIFQGCKKYFAAIIKYFCLRSEKLFSRDPKNYFLTILIFWDRFLGGGGCHIPDRSKMCRGGGHRPIISREISGKWTVLINSTYCSILCH